ncbi:hypothetical protein DPMN_117769 [Dreissena polymorpha]|uniref:Uncharacterized protein n=1 Tax=Dreissena polymorpha TaxID=45954 RepID=A0A9D4GFB1_DREPO|nr:hypothetical protein DPMN_117769 [Dreissena polymorpha]
MDLMACLARLAQVEQVRRLGLSHPSRAFDTIPHRRLLLNLGNYGIRGNLLSCISNFLTRLEMCVVVDVEKSQQVPVGSRVP